MAILTMNEVLANEVQQYLAGSDTVLIKTILDLTSRAKKGVSSVAIPRIAGLALKDVSTGDKQTAGGMTSASDTLTFDQVKEVPEFITYKDDMDSALQLKAAFVNAAPRVFTEGIETILATELVKGAAGNAVAAKIDGSDIITKIGEAKKKLDKQKCPKSDRFLAVNADGMELLAKTSEFQDGSKALSAEALKLGVVSQVKGFFVVQSEDIPLSAGSKVQMVAYHRSHVAFGLHGEMRYIDKEIEECGQFFLSLRAKYGSKVLDSGKRGALITLSEA